MKKKLVLINPVNFSRQGVLVKYPPLALGIIAALTPENWEVELIDENYEVFEFRQADLVGLTAFSSTINRAYEIAQIYKQKQIPTIIGGIHASQMFNESLKYCDSVVIGEAERIWGKVIEDFQNSKLEKIYYGELAPINNIKVNHEIFSENYRYSSVHTSRGCPHNCDFCSVTKFHGNKYRQRPIEDILDELEKIKHKRVFFVDDNLIGSSEKDQKRAISLFKGIIERKIKIYWWSQVAMNFADNKELLYYASKSGCKMVFIGIESELTKSLVEINKNLNLKISVNKYTHVFKAINKFGIAVFGGFIFGIDNDNCQDLLNRADFICKNRIDAIQTSILTPYPGTDLFNKLLKENRIIKNDYPKDWCLYDFRGFVYKPKLIDIEDFEQTMNLIYYKLYNRKTIYKKLILSLFHTKSLKASMTAFQTNFMYRNLLYKGKPPNAKKLSLSSNNCILIQKS